MQDRSCRVGSVFSVLGAIRPTLRLSRRGPSDAGLTAARRPPRPTRDAAGANAAGVTLVRFRVTCQRTGPRRLEPRVRRRPQTSPNDAIPDNILAMTESYDADAS